LGRTYLDLPLHEGGTPQHDEIFWAYECFDEMAELAPRIAFNCVLVALQQCKNDSDIGFLAAGPLEDLVCEHGPILIDEIEREATSNEKFRYLLSGIWGDPSGAFGVPDVDPDVWRRIQIAVRPGPWLNEGDLTPQGSDKSRHEK
jgi:hypothetical protein